MAETRLVHPMESGAEAGGAGRAPGRGGADGLTVAFGLGLAGVAAGAAFGEADIGVRDPGRAFCSFGFGEAVADEGGDLPMLVFRHGPSLITLPETNGAAGREFRLPLEPAGRGRDLAGIGRLGRFLLCIRHRQAVEPEGRGFRT